MSVLLKRKAKNCSSGCVLDGETNLKTTEKGQFATFFAGDIVVDLSFGYYQATINANWLTTVEKDVAL